MHRLLLADDDVELCKLLDQFLRAEDFDVEMVHDGAAVLDRAIAEEFDLVILDVSMPVRNGLDALRLLRARKATPVLMLTARADDVDSIVGLELGADDYLGKPCNPRVLLARIRAILRRSDTVSDLRSNADDAAVLTAGDLTVQIRDRSVRRGTQRIAMTSTEFTVLEVLVRDAGRVVPKAELSRRALGRPLGRFDRSLDMHVSNLRRKLGDHDSGEERIKTVRGAGYQYSVE